MQARVLIIDADAWTRSVMRELLLSDGYAVVEAIDGLTGLQLAEQLQPTLVLLDLVVPRKSGLDVLRELKERRSTRDIPVIVVSAYAQLLLRAEPQLADGFIQKPLDLAELLTHVAQAARQAGARAEAVAARASWRNAATPLGAPRRLRGEGALPHHRQRAHTWPTRGQSALKADRWLAVRRMSRRYTRS